MSFIDTDQNGTNWAEITDSQLIESQILSEELNGYSLIGSTNNTDIFQTVKALQMSYSHEIYLLRDQSNGTFENNGAL